MALTQITVTGKYLQPTGAPAQGSLSFRLSQRMRDSSTNQMVAQTAVSVALDANGAFSVLLLATNDVTTVPEGVTYEVHEDIQGGQRGGYRVVIDAQAAAGAVDLADVEHTPL